MSSSRPPQRHRSSSSLGSHDSSSSSDELSDLSGSWLPPRRRKRGRAIQYRSLKKGGRRYASTDDDDSSDNDGSMRPHPRRAGSTGRGTTKNVVLYVAIGIGLLGVVTMGSYLYQSSTEEPSSGPASTVTATVGSAATTETAVASTSLSSTHAEPSPTAPVASSASSITDDAEEVTSGGGSHPSKAAATSSSAGGSKPSETSSAASAGETYSGKATWYMQRGVAGNCGTVNPESAMICALQTKLYADGKNCGRKIQLTRTDNGKSIVVTVADQCPTCVDSGYVDLSEGAYKELGTEDEGWFDMTWYFVD